MNYKTIRQTLVLTGIAALSVTVLLLAGCSKDTPNEGKSGDATTQSTATKYTCSMHPDVVQDKPGNCPKCGMKLVEKR
jgi:membrane fusion protein, copper/silver efflux system